MRLFGQSSQLGNFDKSFFDKPEEVQEEAVPVREFKYLKDELMFISEAIKNMKSSAGLSLEPLNNLKLQIDKIVGSCRQKRFSVTDQNGELQRLFDACYERQDDQLLAIVTSSIVKVLNGAQKTDFLNYAVIKLTNSPTKTTYETTNGETRSHLIDFFTEVTQSNALLHPNEIELVTKTLFFLNFFFKTDPVLTTVFEYLMLKKPLNSNTFLDKLAIIYVATTNKQLQDKPIKTNMQSIKCIEQRLLSYDQKIISIQSLSDFEVYQIDYDSFGVYVQAELAYFLENKRLMEEFVDLAYGIFKRHKEKEFLVRALTKKLAEGDVYSRFPFKTQSLLFVLLSENEEVDRSRKVRQTIAKNFLSNQNQLWDLRPETYYILLLGLRKMRDEIKTEVQNIRRFQPSYSIGKMNSTAPKSIFLSLYELLFHIFLQRIEEIDPWVRLKVIYEVVITLNVMDYQNFVDWKLEKYVWDLCDAKINDLNTTDTIFACYILKRFLNTGGGKLAKWKRLLNRHFELLKDNPTPRSIQKTDQILSNLETILVTNKGRYLVENQELLAFVQEKRRDFLKITGQPSDRSATAS